MVLPQVLAGALKDNKRALIAGERTFGKGLIQTVVELSDGSAVAVTVSRYALFAMSLRSGAGRLLQKQFTHSCYVKVLLLKLLSSARLSKAARCSMRVVAPPTV